MSIVQLFDVIGGFFASLVVDRKLQSKITKNPLQGDARAKLLQDILDFIPNKNDDEIDNPVQNVIKKFKVSLLLLFPPRSILDSSFRIHNMHVDLIHKGTHLC